MSARLLIAAGGIVLLLQSSVAAATAIIYVDASASDTGDGSSWASAFTDLQDALAAAKTGEEGPVHIWIAAGTYKPGTAEDGPDATFAISGGVHIFGGFSGWETSIEQRDLEANESILSGLLQPAPTLMMSEHLITAVNVEEMVILDGLVFENSWKALRSENSQVTIRESIVRNNSMYFGSVIYVENGALVFEGVHLHQNTVAEAVVEAVDASLTLIDCTFEDHISMTSIVKAMYSEVVILGSVFRKNHVSPVALMKFTSSVISIDGCLFAENGDGPHNSHISVTDSDITITESTFVDTFSDGPDVVLSFSSTVHFVDCSIDSGPWLQGVSIAGNGVLIVERTTMGPGPGGGIHWSGNGLIIDSTISGQSSLFGAGGILWNGELEIVRSIIRESGGLGLRGGVHLTGGSLTLVNSLVRNNTTHYREDPAGVIVTGDATAMIINSTIIDNWGGIYVEPGAATQIANSIIWGNQWFQDWDDDFPETAHELFAPAQISFSCIDSDVVWPGAGNINQDPMFSDSDGRLAAQSPVIDSGNNSLLPPGTEIDLDGNQRIVDGTGDGVVVVDMGAFEYQCKDADLNCDGIVNVFDLFELLGAWGPCENCNSCFADLDDNCTVNVFDLFILLGNWG